MKLIIIGFLYFAIMYLNRKKVSPFACFFIVFIVMAFQSNVTGDFYTYAANFERYRQFGMDINSRLEIGWLWLNRLFGFSNFFVFYFCVALFEIWVLSKFTKKYVPKAYWILPAILFFFDMNMMFFQMKGLRQALAIELGVSAMYIIGDNVTKKNVLISLMLSLLAFSMHQTALWVVVYVVLYIILSKTKVLFYGIKSGSYWLPLIAVGLYYFISISKVLLIDRLRPLLLQLDLGGKEGYFGGMSTVSYHALIDFIKGYFVFYVAYNLKYSYGMQRYITMLCLFGLYMDMFLFGMGNLFRTALYLTIFGIFVYPNVVNSLRMNNRKVEALIFLVLSVAYAFRTFITVSMRGMTDALDNYKFLFEF